MKFLNAGLTCFLQYWPEQISDILMFAFRRYCSSRPEVDFFLAPLTPGQPPPPLICLLPVGHYSGYSAAAAETPTSSPTLFRLPHRLRLPGHGWDTFFGFGRSGLLPPPNWLGEVPIWPYQTRNLLHNSLFFVCAQSLVWLSLFCFFNRSLSDASISASPEQFGYHQVFRQLGSF